jgi:hypothetical protein
VFCVGTLSDLATASFWPSPSTLPCSAYFSFKKFYAS